MQDVNSTTAIARIERRCKGVRLAIVILLLACIHPVAGFAQIVSQPEVAPVHTAWAQSVREALARRMHHAIDAGRSALKASERGMASWYGGRFRGGRTATGHHFDPTELTAAHPTLPMGTKVRVTSSDTGRSVIVTINDRGPFNSRIIDVSRAAAAQLGMLGAGTAHVTLSPLDQNAEVAQASAADTSEQAISFAGRDVPHHASHHKKAR